MAPDMMRTAWLELKVETEDGVILTSDQQISVSLDVPHPASMGRIGVYVTPPADRLYFTFSKTT
jgi:hypothetical protein